MRRAEPHEVAIAAAAVAAAAWAGALLAPALDGDRAGLAARLAAALSDPLAIRPSASAARGALACAGAAALACACYLTSRRNWRRREEHGSAEWGAPRAACRRYRGGEPFSDRLLTERFRMSLDGRRHRRNLNTLVCGGSGSGKTRGYSLPNAMQAASSMVVLDPKGEILREVGGLLEAEGFEVRVLDLVRPELSHCYNPFAYVRGDADAQRLTTNLFKATTPKGAQSQDPFWDTAAGMLHLALMLYLVHEAPPEERNYATLMEMLRAGEVREDDDEFSSVLDELFDRLEMTDPGHIALKYYRSYRSGAAKTLKSIQVTLASRLEKFNLDAIASLTATDEMDLASLGTRRVALFAVIPDNDTSFNFLVSMLYTQLFQQLFSLADNRCGGSLPVHVHFLMDEFANVSLPDDFEKILSTMRGRNVSASIIVQNLAQLKALFEKQWESVVGNCDEFLYLGGNEQSTHKYVSELLGKETIDSNTYARSTGRGGSYSTNWQISGRELMTPDEVRMLPDDRALLFVRGERPMLDGKLDFPRHPRHAMTADGGAAPYEHGVDRLSVAAIEVAPAGAAAQGAPRAAGGYEIVSEEELEAELGLREEEGNQT
uniref:VirD4-like conjugal transfer protein, CD1115 family n=1 Tax=Olsenella timonensis TaxID=1805478 RepID=UPI00094F0D87|nr:type IV secretory system conjugative DNA transfer family protein [Olsenella timonensis]